MTDLLALSARIIEADVYDRELSRINQNLFRVENGVVLIETAVPAELDSLSPMSYELNISKS